MNRQTPDEPPSSQAPAHPIWVSSKHDPVLQELWGIKAEINAGAHYSVIERAKQLETVTIDKLLAGLK